MVSLSLQSVNQSKPEAGSDRVLTSASGSTSTASRAGDGDLLGGDAVATGDAALPVGSPGISPADLWAGSGGSGGRGNCR